MLKEFELEVGDYAFIDGAVARVVSIGDSFIHLVEGAAAWKIGRETLTKVAVVYSPRVLPYIGCRVISVRGNDVLRGIVIQLSSDRALVDYDVKGNLVPMWIYFNELAVKVDLKPLTPRVSYRSIMERVRALMQ